MLYIVYVTITMDYWYVSTIAIFAEFDMDSLLLFPHTQSGYQIARSLKELGLWSTSQLVPVKWSLHLKLGVLFRCLLSKVIFFYTKVRYI